MGTVNPLRFGAACRYALPQQRCCNCGAMSGRRTVEAAAPLPPPLIDLPDRARRYLLLELPFCGSCEPTASRMPPRWHRLVIGGVLAAVYLFLLALPLMSASGLGGHKVLPLLLPLLAGGLLAGPAWRLLQRRAPGQSSAFAPVRVSKLATRGDEVVALRFDFTHAGYARDFAAAHAALVAARTLEYRVVSGR